MTLSSIPTVSGPGSPANCRTGEGCRTGSSSVQLRHSVLSSDRRNVASVVIVIAPVLVLVRHKRTNYNVISHTGDLVRAWQCKRFRGSNNGEPSSKVCKQHLYGRVCVLATAKLVSPSFRTATIEPERVSRVLTWQHNK